MLDCHKPSISKKHNICKVQYTRYTPVLVFYCCCNKWLYIQWFKTIADLLFYSPVGQKSDVGLTGLKSKCLQGCDLFWMQGVPDVAREPPDEAGLMRKFEK